MGGHSEAGHQAAEYEILHEDSDPSASFWRKMRRSLAPVIGLGQSVLGDVYATTARLALERKESFEDLQAERKAKNRLAVKARRQG